MTEVEFALLERLKEAHIEIGELRQRVFALEAAINQTSLFEEVKKALEERAERKAATP